jgi:hypothetical protein
MPYIDTSADFTNGSFFRLETGRTTVPTTEVFSSAIVLAAFCNMSVNKSARFTAQDAEFAGMVTRTNRYSVNEYVVVGGALYDVEDYPETFRVVTSVQGWNMVSTPRTTDPLGLGIVCTSRWVPKVGARAMYDAGVWRPYEGGEPLEMFAVSPGDPQTPQSSSSFFPILLDNGAYTYVDRQSGVRVEADAVQFNATAKLSTNTSQWGSGHVAAMAVVVPNRSWDPNQPIHIIGFAPNERARTAGFTVSINSNSIIQLWSDRTEEMSADDWNNQNLIAEVNPRTDISGELSSSPMVLGLRYDADTQVATLLVCSPFVPRVEVSKEWVLWRGVPVAERLASCNLQLLYSNLERHVEVLDVSLWLGKMNDLEWQYAAQQYMQCYGVV